MTESRVERASEWSLVFDNSVTGIKNKNTAKTEKIQNQIHYEKPVNDLDLQRRRSI